MLRNFRRERAQTLPLFAMLLVAFIGMVGLAIDAGRLYVARAELTRALDSAALAGVIELPDLDEAEAAAIVYMNDNDPRADVVFPTQVENQFRVEGTRSVRMIFMGFLGFNSMNVNAQAAAGFGIVPSDTVMLLDATGSMGANTGTNPPCNTNQNNSGCPILEAKAAAQGFKDLFLGSGAATTKVGYTPFRGCHNPPRNNTRCIQNSARVDLTTSSSAVSTAITNTVAPNNALGQGGSGTNTCLALSKAQEMFNGSNAQTASNTVKSVVILSDGNNVYNATEVYQASPASPPTTPACRPSSNPSTSDADTSTSCATASNRAQSRSVDTRTVTLVNTMKAAGIEVYVIAFDVCGTANSTVASTSYCANIGNTDPDTVADQRLLKCIASSTAGTNDHYFAVPTAQDLPEVFQDVARAISFRLIE